jgi:hypothetical protein
MGVSASWAVIPVGLTMAFAACTFSEPPGPSTQPPGGGRPPPADSGAGPSPPPAPPPRVDAAAPMADAARDTAVERPPVGPAPDADQPPPPPAGMGIESAAVSGFQLLVRRRQPGGTAGPAEPFDVRGISWSPAERGAGRPDSDSYLRAADRDLPMMRAANINVVKTYLPVRRAVLDRLQAHGLAAIVTVLNVSGEIFEATVAELKDHPALLMWLLGNEWNLNRLYGSCELSACFDRVNEVARRIKALDPKHPVATSFAPSGELPTDAEVARLEAVEVWGLNVYSQPGFFNRFADWRLQAQRTGIRKPLLLTEYGADAFDNRTGRTDEASQAAALRRQTTELRGQLSARNPAFPVLGGTPFEWNDEWWKRGNPAAQDPGGFAHDGVAADRFANEEWWGVVDVDRRPRAAYQVLKELYAP